MQFGPKLQMTRSIVARLPPVLLQGLLGLRIHVLRAHGTVDCNGTHRPIFGAGMPRRSAKAAWHLHGQAFKHA